MLQTQCVTALEQRIIGSGALQLTHLSVVRDRLLELTVVEETVAYSVQRVGISRFRCLCLVYVQRERLTGFVVMTLRESAVTGEVICHRVVA